MTRKQLLQLARHRELEGSMRRLVVGALKEFAYRRVAAQAVYRSVGLEGKVTLLLWCFGLRKI